MTTTTTRATTTTTTNSQLYEEMVAATDRASSTRSREVVRAHNYVLLAHGHASGYEAALERFEAAQRGRSRRPAPTHGYAFMIELVTTLHSKKGKGGADARGHSELWERLQARRRDSSRMCRMFGVWAQAGELHGRTPCSSRCDTPQEMRAYGNDLASHWLGYLDRGRDILSSRPTWTSASSASLDAQWDDQTYLRDKVRPNACWRQLPLRLFANGRYFQAHALDTPRPTPMVIHWN